jgi:zinc protease
VDRLLRDGVTKEELDQARQGWLQSQKVARSSDSALAVLLNGLRFVDRTMMWDADLEKKVEALTPDQVVAALRKYVDPKKLVIVTAGDFETKATASAQ